MKEIFEKNNVDQIPTPKGHVVIVDSDLIPIQGFNLILENKIQSAPVYDKVNKKFTGFLDIRDLVSFCIFIHDNNVQAESLLDIVNFGVKMFKHHADVTVTYLSRRNTFRELVLGSPLSKAVSLLSHGLHRIPIVDQSGKLVNIISQSSLLQFIDNHLDSKSFPELDKKLSELSHIGTSPVLNVKASAPAIDAFRTMDHYRRSGIAIVDDQDRLIGSTSSKDLQIFITTPSVALLHLPISEFLNKIRQMKIGIQPLITATNDDTLKSIIQKMVSNRVHRLFVIDENQKLQKVISITDILKLLC